VTWDGFQLWACVAHVEALLSMLAAMFVVDPLRFSYRAAGGSRKDDWICSLAMDEVRAIPGQLTLRDFISGVRDCTHGRLVTDSGVTGSGQPAAPSGPPENLGPSDGPLGNALGVTRVDGVTEPRASVSDDDDLAEVFERPGVATFFGIGDSEERFVGEHIER
jgi:hypothetical protein